MLGPLAIARATDTGVRGAEHRGSWEVTSKAWRRHDLNKVIRQGGGGDAKGSGPQPLPSLPAPT